MQSVSDQFLAALRTSHTKVYRCDLWRQNEQLAHDIPVINGSLTDDSQSISRRRVSLYLPPTSDILGLLPELAPIDGGLWPLGNELHLHGGIRFSDGSEELVPMGVYRIARPTLSDGESGMGISIEGYDRARTVNRFRFTEPYVIEDGTNYSTAIKELIMSRMPWLDPDEDFAFMSTSYSTPALVFVMDDPPMEMAQAMAASIGAEVFFDGSGRCVLRPEPDPLYTPSSFSYIEGPEATITSIERDLDDEMAYNGVIVTGESTSNNSPIRAEVWDNNPDSPTYFDPSNPEASVYGAVPYFMSSQYITTQSQAEDAANANLARVLGVIESINFGAINNPAHESGDVIDIRRSRLGVDGTAILESIQMGIGDDSSMAGTTRKRRVV